MTDKEKLRLEAMLEIENELANSGKMTVAGVDEAGRGPLIGDVFAAAVILPRGLMIEGLKDSKKLSEKKREALFDVICEKAIAYGIGRATASEIDEINIRQATFLAMKRAVDALSQKPDFVLVDGNASEKLDIPHRCIVKGDSKCMSIAAASIIAKVSRDRYMRELDKKYPGYNLAGHKGYGTAEHIACIREIGPCPEHRKTFLKKILSR